MIAVTHIPRLRGEQGQEFAVLKYPDHHLQAGIAILVPVGRVAGFEPEGDDDYRFLVVHVVLQVELV